MALTRRALLAAGLGGAVAAGAGADAVSRSQRLHNMLFGPPHAFVPNAPEGRVRLEEVHSEARGRTVSLFTAVPAGHGDGAGLPVCLVLHGASARPPDFRPFGLPRFLTAAVRRGAPPFVLAGADGGLLSWEADRSGVDDPQRMMLEEMPRWLAERGFDAGRLVAWGWSMGGYGALRLAEVRPGWLRSVAAFSPAVGEGDPVFAGASRLRGTPLAIWCARDDGLFPAVRDLVAALPERPRLVSYGEGGHTRVYWDSVTLRAFAFLGAALA